MKGGEDLSAFRAQHRDPELIHHHIQCRAYELWQERGRPEGSPEEDWFVAERELSSRHADPLEIDPFLTTVAVAV